MLYCIDHEGTIIEKDTKKQKMKIEDKQSSVTFTDDNATVKQVGLFSKQVIEKMINEKIPATPENYSIYFEKLLEEKPLVQRKNILKVLDAEAIEEHNYVAQVENNIKESFSQIKAILDTVSNMYSKINKLRKLTKIKKQEILNGSGQVALVAYKENLDEVIETLEKQQASLKERYIEVSESIKQFHKNSIFDPKYDVYNKNYLFKALEAEKKNISTFGHESSILAFKIQTESFEKIKLRKDQELVIKNVANMIMNRSRRSDIVAHLGNDIFIILLKHTNVSQAQKAIESIDHMISFTNYIVDSQNIDIALDFAATKIVTHQTKEQIISTAINQLH